MTPESASLSQLKLRCRRGMLELDLIMERYLLTHYANASREEQAQFIDLLEMQDPELYPLVTGASSPPADLQPLIDKIKTPGTHSPEG